MKLKHCYLCRINLPIECFFKNKSSYDGLANGCKKCRNTLKKEYYRNNKEKSKGYSEFYRNSHKEESKKYQIANKEKLASYHKKYEKEHKENRRIIWERRRSRKKQLCATFTTEEWEKCKQIFDNKCCYCGRKLPLEKEHFIPLTNNGEYTINNIIPACKSCNSSKGNKDFFKWYPTYEFYNKKRYQTILTFLNYNNGNQQLGISM